MSRAHTFNPEPLSAFSLLLLMLAKGRLGDHDHPESIFW